MTSCYLLICLTVLRLLTEPEDIKILQQPPTGPHVAPKQSSPHIQTSLHQHCAFMSTDLSQLVSTLWSLNWHSDSFKHNIPVGFEPSQPAWVHHISIIYWRVRRGKLLHCFLFLSFTLNIEIFLYVQITRKYDGFLPNIVPKIWNNPWARIELIGYRNKTIACT